MECINENIHVIRNGIFPSNTYLLSNPESKDCIVIDPGLDRETIEREIVDSGLRPIAILATHGHFDHIGSVSVIKEKYLVPFYLHEADFKISQSANFYLKMARIDAQVETTKPDILFKSNEEHLSIGSFELIIHHLPGHSPGSCIIQYKHYLFSGDLLFKSAIGDDSIPKADLTLLKESLTFVMTSFKANDLILPGHGQPATLGEIQQENTVLKNFLSKTVHL